MNEGKEIPPTIHDLVHYKYVGGGYFRDNRVPKGEKANMVHGPELLEIIELFLKTEDSENV